MISPPSTALPPVCWALDSAFHLFQIVSSSRMHWAITTLFCLWVHFSLIKMVSPWLLVNSYSFCKTQLKVTSLRHSDIMTPHPFQNRENPVFPCSTPVHATCITAPNTGHHGCVCIGLFKGLWVWELFEPSVLQWCPARHRPFMQLSLTTVHKGYMKK